MPVTDVKALSAVVVEAGPTPALKVKALSAVVVESGATPATSVKALSAVAVERFPPFGGLAQVLATDQPEYIIENGTPYVKFEVGTNNKQLFFYPEIMGEYHIIALRPNLLDFFESKQTFTGPAQIAVPHFNQIFMTQRVLENAEVAAIKSDMTSRAEGTGIDLEIFEFVQYSAGLINQDASNGLNDWVTTDTEFGTSTSFSPPVNTNSFWGGPASNTSYKTLHQTVDVSAYASNIDDYDSSVSITWYQWNSSMTWHPKGNIHVHFYDASASQLGAHTPNPDYPSLNTWNLRDAGVLAIPTGTRSIKFSIVAQSGISFRGRDVFFNGINAQLNLGNALSNSVIGGLKDPYVDGKFGTPA